MTSSFSGLPVWQLSRQNYQEKQYAKNYVIIAINLLPAEQESEILSLKTSFIGLVALQVNGVVYT